MLFARASLVVTLPLLTANLVACDEDETNGGVGGSAPEPVGGHSAGGGAGGSGTTPCDASATASAPFSVALNDWCITGSQIVSPAISYLMAPTWGSHGGPLTFDVAGDKVTLHRWNHGTSTDAVLTLPSSLPDLEFDGGFVGSQVVDFQDQILVTYTAAFPDPRGWILGYGGGDDAERQVVVPGPFSMAPSPDGAALAFSALGPFGDETAGSPRVFRATCLAGPTCTLNTLVTDGDYSGPVAYDETGVLFAVTPSADGTQQLHRIDDTGHTEGPSIDGTGTALAASGGLVFFQPYDGSSKPQDVIVWDWSDAEAVSPQTALTLTEPGTALSLMRGEGQALWVGAAVGNNKTNLYRIERSPE